jgi:hypothetical protein
MGPEGEDQASARQVRLRGASYQQTAGYRAGVEGIVKDWKTECDVLRGRIKELERQLLAEQLRRADREERDRDLHDKFKELLIDVLGK